MLLDERCVLIAISPASISAAETIRKLEPIFGTARESVVGSKRFGDGAYPVRPIGQNGVQDRFGVTITSTTYREFTLHTDAYNAEVRPRILLMACEQPGTGGRSLFLPLDTFLHQTEPLLLDRLRTLPLPTREGDRIALTNDDQQLSINSYEIECIQRERGESRMQPEFLQNLQSALRLDRATISIHLKSGETAIVQNRKCLHGRTALAGNDNDRLVWRRWLD